MAELVANLLQFSRRSQQQISTVDIKEEIENTVGLVQYHLRKYKVAVTFDIDPNLPSISADRQQLRQLFLNLFTNSADACPHGGTLTIRAKKDEARKAVVIEISDTGTGIPADLLPKIFEPFFTTKAEGKGTGLGLAICRRIAQEHHGSIEVSSDGIQGHGTTFRITLPLRNGTNGNYLKSRAALTRAQE